MSLSNHSRTHWNNIAFIAILCERHCGNALLFYDLTQQTEQGQQFRRCLNKVWEYLAGQLTSEKNLEKALASLEEITPEPADELGYGVYPAIDACTLLTSAMQMILDASIDDTETASELSKATVAQFIEMSEQAPFNPETDTHELYSEEQSLQHWALESLQTEGSRAELIKTIRKSLAELQHSNLGISLNED